MLQAGRGRLPEALAQFAAAGRLQSQLAGSLALASQVTGWLLATQARLGMTGEARAGLAALADELAGSGEIGNARAVICLAEGDPAAALGAVRDVLDGTAPVIGYVTWWRLTCWPGRLAWLGDQRAANEGSRTALALAEADRWCCRRDAGARQLLGPCRGTRPHTRRCSRILDHMTARPRARDQHPAACGGAQPGGASVLRDLPTTCPGRRSQPNCRVGEHRHTHIRSIYAKLGADDRSVAVRRARQLRLLLTGPHAGAALSGSRS